MMNIERNEYKKKNKLIKNIWIKLSIWLPIWNQFESNTLKLLGIRVEFYFRQWLKFLGQNDYIFSFSY